MPYDRFRDRVIFPDFRLARARDRIRRARARSGRAGEISQLAGDAALSQGLNLYNGANARQAAHDGATIIAVEGYVDVIAMVTAGFPATVAPLGTALTEEQLGLLWKMADEPLLCFDGDKAGRRAAYRALDLALPKLLPGKSLKFALLPEGQDPDDLARSGGREAIAEVLTSARSLSDMLWLRESEISPHDTPERKAALEARIGEIIGGIAQRNRAALLPRRFSGASARAVHAAKRRRHSRATRSFDRRNTQGRDFAGRDWKRGGTQRAAARSVREPVGAACAQARWSAAQRARCRRARRSFCSP